MIYLDHNATTAVLPEVANALWPFLIERWGNPSSAYRFGAEVRHAIDEARGHVAALVGAQAQEVIFTSGATEANNTAIRAALACSETRRHIVTSNAEHSSVLATCQAVAAEGAEVTHLRVDRSGQIDLEELEAAIRSDTALVALMWANNETGVIAPIERIVEICRQRNVPLHCDGVQAAGRIQMQFGSLGIDYLSISGHKFGAPKGVGALIAKNGAPFTALIHGGKQQDGRRGGTESVPLIVAMGAASRVARTTLCNWDNVAVLRDHLEARILTATPTSYRNGGPGHRLPNTLNFGITGVDSDGLVAYFDLHDICVSSGSACMANSIAPSHVVMAMTGSYDRANEAIRVSLGLDTKQSDIDRFWELLQAYIKASRLATGSVGPAQNSAGNLSRTS